MLNEGFSDILCFICSARKLLNHPQLIYQDNNESSLNFKKYFKNDYKSNNWDLSNKFKFLSDILDKIFENSDKIIIVSYYTQTLDLIQDFCNEKSFKTVRLDGKVAAK